MYNMIREQSIVAMELKTPYSPVIHNPKAIANYQYLDSKFCAGKLMDECKSALMILLDIKMGTKLGVN